MDKRETMVREWFGAVRSAADAGVKVLENAGPITPFQRVKLNILFRQEQCDLLSLVIKSAEYISQKEASEVRAEVYSRLMEDAVAGIWSEEENIDMVLFLGKCSEGIGGDDDFCDYASEVLDAEKDTILRAKKTAGNLLNDFIRERKAINSPKQSRREDEPPPGLDEFEYIDWVMTH